MKINRVSCTCTIDRKGTVSKMAGTNSLSVEEDRSVCSLRMSDIVSGTRELSKLQISMPCPIRLHGYLENDPFDELSTDLLSAGLRRLSRQKDLVWCLEYHWHMYLGLKTVLSAKHVFLTLLLPS